MSQVPRTREPQPKPEAGGCGSSSEDQQNLGKAAAGPTRRDLCSSCLCDVLVASGISLSSRASSSRFAALEEQRWRNKPPDVPRPAAGDKPFPLFCLTGLMPESAQALESLDLSTGHDPQSPALPVAGLAARTHPPSFVPPLLTWGASSWPATPSLSSDCVVLRGTRFADTGGTKPKRKGM